MKEVSCKALWPHVGAARQLRVPLERLLEGLPITPEQVQDPAGRIGWQTYCLLTARLDHLGGSAELDPLCGLLGRQALQLQKVNLLGRELTRHLELGPLADALVAALTEDFGAAGVSVAVLDPGTRAERWAYQAGERSGPASRREALWVAGEQVGRLELWGAGLDRGEAGDLLDDVVPWISIALQNARSFAAARQAQANLDAMVAARDERLQRTRPQARWAAPAARPSAASPGEEPDRPILLVAEDAADVRRSIVRCLRDEFEVLEASDGAEALELARAHLPEIILSDILMPRMDGIELCRAVKSTPAMMATPVVLLTARGEIDDRLSGFRGGADDYVVKPFHPEELRARLRSQLRLRRLSEAVAHSEKLAALGTVVAGVAHEVRNPLNGLINSLGPLKEALSGAPARITELLDLAIESSKRVEHVSGMLLRQAHVGADQRSSVDVGQNIALALQLLGHKLEAGPSIVARIPSDQVLAVTGDPGSLNQVWINLIDNAIQAAGRSGQVEIALRRLGTSVIVEVADDGPGIDPRFVKRIFDPFFTTKPVGQGTGLGLSLVREIVGRHGGVIAVDSKQGAGARFQVTLPAANASPGDLDAEG